MRSAHVLQRRCCSCGPARYATTTKDALSAALDPFTAPLGEQPPVAPDDNSPQPETFEDQSAALKVASARLEAFKAEFGSSSAVAAADLALAGSQMRSGNSADAIAKLESWIAANANSPLKAGALMRLGEASLDVGNVDGARKAFEQLEAFATTDKLKAIALASLGDLDNPMVVKGGDAAAARKRYEAARALLGEEPTGATGIAAFLGSKAKQMRTELDDKLASLP